MESNLKNKLMIVGIFAHNEEGVIKKTVECVLSQRISEGYTKSIFVIANACTDSTEKIVNEISKQNPEVKLVSIAQKGKVIAIKKFIDIVNEYTKNSRNKLDQNIVLMDADVSMIDKNTLSVLNSKLESEVDMDAIIASWVPESVYNKNRDLVSNLYRVLYKLQSETMRERFRAMCYIIRLEVLNKIEFMDNLIADDQYLQYKLRGKYKTFKDIKVTYGIPKSISDEFRRRQRHAVALQQIRELYKLGKLEQIYGGSKDATEGSVTEEEKSVLRLFIKISIEEKIYLAIIVLIRFVTGMRAKRLYKKLKESKKSILEIWKTNR